MNFELDEEHQMLKDLVARFVREHLLPLEPAALARQAATGQLTLPDDDRARLDKLSKELGLWGLDAPQELGGHDLPVTAMVGAVTTGRASVAQAVQTLMTRPLKEE